MVGEVNCMCGATPAVWPGVAPCTDVCSGPRLPNIAPQTFPPVFFFSGQPESMIIAKLNRCKKLHDDRAKVVTQPTHYPFTPGNNTRIGTKIQRQAPLGDSIAKLYQDGSYPPQMTLPACSKEVTQRKSQTNSDHFRTAPKTQLPFHRSPFPTSKSCRLSSSAPGVCSSAIL